MMNTDKLRGLAASVTGGGTTLHIQYLADDVKAAADRIDQMDYAIKEAVHFFENAMSYGIFKHQVDVQKAEYVLNILRRAENT